MRSKIAILGAGSWGIALGVMLNSEGHRITLWEFDPKEMIKLKKKRGHPKKLPGIKIPERVKITDDLEEAVFNSDLLLLAIPSHTVREVAKKLAKIDLNQPLIVNLAKGIENETLCRMSEVLTSELPENLHKNITTLSGPSHAEEVSKKIPTTVVVAGFDEKVAQKVQKTLINPYFRIYTNSDLIGVELGGSLKNVIAIASGICDGLNLGDNTKGALLTRGLAEMIRLGEKLGAFAQTFAGLSGMGDLITTCFSPYSRNRFVGEQIGKGRKLKKILKDMVMVAEGVKTTLSVYKMSKKFKVEMPITEEVCLVLFKNKDPVKGVYDLMSRGPKSEIWG